MASLGSWTLPFYSLARISPTFVALHRFPSSQRPCFSQMVSQRSGPSSSSSGDHYNSETAGASCWSPRTWHMDGNLGLRAEDAAPRSVAPRDSGRPNRVGTRRQVRLVGPSRCWLKYNPAKEPTQVSRTRLVRSALRQHAMIFPASRFASHSIAPRAASSSLGTASAPSFWRLRPARNYAPGHTYGNRIPATRGEACRSCPPPTSSATPQRNRPKPQQPDLFGPRYASMLYTFAGPVLRILLASLREQPAHVSAPSQHLFLGVSDQLGIMPQGRHTGIERG